MGKPNLRRCATIGALLCSTAAGAASLVTIVDGEATLVDGPRAAYVVEGLKLPEEAIVRTTAKTTLVRIEWPDGNALDLGPDTQVMLEPPALAARGGRGPAVYVLRGWVKQSSLGSAATGALATSRVEVASFKGALVVMATAEETWLFAETGSAQVTERDAKPPAALALPAGAVYERAAGGKGDVAPRPTPAQMQRVPRGFRDALPLRAAGVKDRKVEPRAAPAPGYAELQEWLAIGEPGIRKGNTKRFGARAKEPAFRAGLAERLGAHPEWEPVLFPERFVKPASTPGR